MTKSGATTWTISAVLMAIATGCASAATPVHAPTSDVVTTAAEPVAVVAETPAAAVTPATTPDVAPEPASEEPTPTACAGRQSLKDVSACLPPAAFVRRTCAGRTPDGDLAITLFEKGTPWTRVWLAGDVEAWSASGGFTSKTTVAFDEEVLVLARHAAPSVGGIVMTGAAANYDVLRADGSCVSISEGELTTHRPPSPTMAPLKWNRLTESTRSTLLESPKVAAAHAAMEKACRSDSKSTACTKAEKSLAIAATTARPVRLAARQ